MAARQTPSAALDARIAELPLEELRLYYRNLLIDTSEDDTTVRQLASQVLTDVEVNGDSYGVPGVPDIVELLVARVKPPNYERGGKMMTRQEHLDWCKQRALEYVSAGDNQQAFASMCSDVMKHEETKGHATTNQLGVSLLVSGHLDSPKQMRDWINGYN